ncbi:hypothetical protein ACLB2K_032206 [Fragaria x ananassa]
MAAVTSHPQNTSCLTNAHPIPKENKMDIRWFPPSHDRVKINFDGSVQSNSAARGFIVRTETGKSLAAACFNLGTTTVPVVEVFALRNSLIYAKNQGLVKIEVEGDSKLDMDKSWISLPRYHRKYAEGVWDFMQYAQANADGSGMFYCPCKMCKCRSDMHRFPFDTVWDHLKSNGFWERYTCWIYHGETSSRPHDHGQFYQTGSTSNDPTTAFINDMFPHDSGVCPERQDIPQAPMQAVPRGVNNAGIAKYNRLIAFQQTPLCPGHEKIVLQCVMEVMHIKVDTKSTVTAVDRYLQYAASLLPDGHRHPTTHHKVRRILRDLGLSYIKIHRMT